MIFANLLEDPAMARNSKSRKPLPRKPGWRDVSDEFWVESRCGAVDTWPRFHTPLIKLDVQFSRIQLSDKAS